MFRWTDEEKAYIKSHCAECSRAELARRMSELFRPVSEAQVVAWMKNNHVANGRDTRFSKGGESWNKGRRQIDVIPADRLAAVRRNWFRKGHVPHNKVPVGTELVKDDGYLWRKVADPDVWRQCHLLFWEKLTGEAVPDGKRVIFLNGDRMDIREGNLMLVSLEELGHTHILRQLDKEGQMRKAVVLERRLENAIKAREEGCRGTN